MWASRDGRRGGRAAEVGTALLCIFNDRPMPGARESGKILFVTCWRCAGAPAPRLISGKMRMLAGWPVGLAGRGGQSWGLQDPQSHQVGPNQGAWHGDTVTILSVWAVGTSEGSTPCTPPANATPFPSSPALGAAYCSAAPAPQVGTARGTFCWSIHCTLQRGWVLPDPQGLSTRSAHPMLTVPHFLELPPPRGLRSALRPAQIYPFFYIHTPLIFTALLEQYPGLLITLPPPILPILPSPPPFFLHDPTKVPSGSGTHHPPLVSSRAGHPLPTHGSGCRVQMLLCPAEAGDAQLEASGGVVGFVEHGVWPRKASLCHREVV